MKRTSLNFLCLLLACFTLLHVAAFAQSSEHSQNLLICMQALGVCDKSQLTATEAVSVARAEHQRNFADCRSGKTPCDRSKLTPAEERASAVAWQQRNGS